MGIYLNPGNDSFRRIRNGIYVDKTGLIDYINSTIDTPDNMTCFSRPRRFGKSFAAKMLCAYYDKSCDSSSLFEGLEIAEKESFERYRNKYHVIFLDITRFISSSSSVKGVVRDIQAKVIGELKGQWPDWIKEEETVLADALFAVADRSGERFIVIIDEWDALFREAKGDKDTQKEYVQLLRGLFKGGPATDRSIAAAYMTGILPIKKYGTESALTDFREFTMVNPTVLAKYVGFTEQEVRGLCEKYHMSYDSMSVWYDGYSFDKIQHVYSPNSVIRAIKNEEFENYWTMSETYESLKDYISMNFDGLKDAIVSMLSGNTVRVTISRFQNDVTSFRSRDDVLTLLIHLGYLGYHAKERKVFIPNQEVSDAFADAVSGDGWEDIGQLIQSQ